MSDSADDVTYWQERNLESIDRAHAAEARVKELEEQGADRAIGHAKAFAAGSTTERAAVVAWARSKPWATTLAWLIEQIAAGDHLTERSTDGGKPKVCIICQGSHDRRDCQGGD